MGAKPGQGCSAIWSLGQLAPLLLAISTGLWRARLWKFSIAVSYEDWTGWSAPKWSARMEGFPPPSSTTVHGKIWPHNTQFWWGFWAPAAFCQQLFRDTLEHMGMKGSSCATVDLSSGPEWSGGCPTNNKTFPQIFSKVKVWVMSMSFFCPDIKILLGRSCRDFGNKGTQYDQPKSIKDQVSSRTPIQ